MKILKFRTKIKEETEMAKYEFNLDGTNTDRVSLNWKPNIP